MLIFFSVDTRITIIRETSTTYIQRLKLKHIIFIKLTKQSTQFTENLLLLLLLTLCNRTVTNRIRPTFAF